MAPGLRIRPWLTAALCTLLGAGAPTVQAAPQRVASINLCTDQLLLLLADREQIASLSWLAGDPEESAFAALATDLPVNHGLAEQLLPLQPDLVLAGSHTAPFTVALLRRLGYRVLTVEPARSLADVERTVLRVADALGQTARGRRMVGEFAAERQRLADTAPRPPVRALLLQTGGFTSGDGLTQELMTLAGLDNLAATMGLDRWGSLSVEAMLRTDPQVLVMPAYRGGEPSLANTSLQHPALRRFTDGRGIARPPSAWLGCETSALLQAARVMRDAATSTR